MYMLLAYVDTKNTQSSRLQREALCQKTNDSKAAWSRLPKWCKIKKEYRAYPMGAEPCRHIE